MCDIGNQSDLDVFYWINQKIRSQQSFLPNREEEKSTGPEQKPEQKPDSEQREPTEPESKQKKPTEPKSKQRESKRPSRKSPGPLQRSSPKTRNKDRRESSRDMKTPSESPIVSPPTGSKSKRGVSHRYALPHESKVVTIQGDQEEKMKQTSQMLPYRPGDILISTLQQLNRTKLENKDYSLGDIRIIASKLGIRLTKNTDELYTLILDLYNNYESENK